MSDISRVVLFGKDCLKVEGAVLGPWRSNFAGVKDQNGDSTRCFYIRLTPEQAEELINVDGFTCIKQTKEDPEGRYEQEWYAKVRVKFHDEPEKQRFNPNINLVSGNGRFVRLTPETIGELDGTRFESVDLTISSNEWEGRNGFTKTMYCSEGYFKPIVASAWSDKYNMTDIPDDGEGGFDN